MDLHQNVAILNVRKWCQKLKIENLRHVTLIMSHICFCNAVGGKVPIAYDKKVAMQILSISLYKVLIKNNLLFSLYSP